MCASGSQPPDGPFLVTVDGTPDLSRMQARHSDYLLTSRGVRLPTVEADAAHARLLAAQLPLRPESVLSHSTAAQVHGLPLPKPLAVVVPAHVTTPRHIPRPRRRDVITHHAQLPATDVTEISGLKITTPARTYIDLAAQLTLSQLVAVGDVLLRCHGTHIDELLALARARVRYPGRARAVSAIRWLDAGAESPRESQLRVLLGRARLPTPEVNGVISDDEGGFLARGDLVFRRQRVVVEYDGEVHAPMRQRARDAARRALLRQHGWIVVEIVGEDMHYPHRVIERVRAALDDGATRPRDRWASPSGATP